MEQPVRRGGLQRRLFLFFLFLWVIPTLAIAFFGAQFLLNYSELLGTPAIMDTMENSLEIARHYYDKLEHDSEEALLSMAGSFPAGAQAGGAALSDFLESVVVENHVDFAAVYSLRDSLWVRTASHPEGPARVDESFAAGSEYELMEPNRIALSDPDVVASGMRRDDGLLLVSGYVLSPGRIDQIRSMADDVQRYNVFTLYLRDLRTRVRIVILALAGVLVASSFIFARVVSIRTTRPLQQLAAATERIADGDLTQRVDIEAKDAGGEIGTLVSAFNRMTENLQEAQRTLVRTERIAAWREVARRLAHEIKNPLTPIQVSIHRIKKRLKGDDEDTRVIEECLDSILKEVTNLRTIAEEFSTFAKLPEPRFKEMDVNETIRSVIDLYTSSLENIEVVTAYGERLPPVYADHDQVRSVFSNIIKNAIEAMPDGGVIVIVTAVVTKDEPGAGRYVRAEISDSGGGIPKDIAEQIFNPYFTTKSEGTGLGLALAYRIVKDHKGDIGFTTSADGTTFAIDLPVWES